MNKSILFILFFLISTFLFSQSNIGLWTSLSIEKTISRSISIGYTEELRFVNSSINLNNIRNNLEVKYSVSKKIKTSVEYIIISKSYINYFVNKKRLSMDIQYKDKKNKWRYSTELKYSWQDKNLFSTDEDGSYPKPFIRMAGEIKRPIVKSLSALVKYQLYFSLYNQFEMEKQRLALGVEHKINQQSTFGLSGYLQQSAYGFNTWILSFEYQIKY